MLDMLNMLDMFDIPQPKLTQCKRISHILHLTKESSMKEVNKSCIVLKNMDCGASTQVVCSLYQPRIVVINLHGVFCHIFVLSDIFASGLLLLFY